MNQSPIPPSGPLGLSVKSTFELSAALKGEVESLCSRAFNQDFGGLFGFVEGASEPGHVLAYRDEQLVGHAVWSTRWLQPDGRSPLRTAYVDAVATDPTCWGQGIGSAVIGRLLEETQGYAIRGLSTSRISFYRRLGWELWRGPKAVRAAAGLVYTPDEGVMIHRTPLTPPLDLDSLLTVEWRGGQPW